MKIKFEINGKALLGLTLLSAGLAFGDFVSIVDTKGSGGISVPGMTDKDKEEILLESMPVGSVTFRMDAANPSTIYGGTWQLITGDASVRLGNGTVQDSSLKGLSNTPSVPLRAHTHTATQASHSHTRGSMNITGVVTAPGAANMSVGDALTGSGAFATYGPLTEIDDIDSAPNGGSVYRSVDFVASRTWTGSTSASAPAITVNQAGDASDKLDVRGHYITLNVWKRIS